MMGACFNPIVGLIIIAIIIMIMIIFIVMIMVMIIIVVVDIMITMTTIISQVVHVLYQENDWVYVISEDSKEGFIPYRFLII